MLVHMSTIIYFHLGHSQSQCIPSTSKDFFSPTSLQALVHLVSRFFFPPIASLATSTHVRMSLLYVSDLFPTGSIQNLGAPCQCVRFFFFPIDPSLQTHLHPVNVSFFNVHLLQSSIHLMNDLLLFYF
jgi:hypothetical protein